MSITDHHQLPDACPDARPPFDICNSTIYSALHPGIYQISIPIIELLCLLAALLNIVVLMSVRFISTRLTSTLKLTFSLAASDIWTSIIVGVGTFYNSYMPVVLGACNVSLCFPLALEAFRVGGLLTGTMHLLALSVNHYFSIARPFDHERILSPFTIHFIIVFMWLAPVGGHLLFSSALPCRGFRSYFGKCESVAYTSDIGYRLCVSLLIVALMTIMFALYGRILCILQNLGAKLDSGVVLAKRISSASSGKDRTSLVSVGRQHQLARHRSTVVTAGLICGTFVIGWLPNSLQFVLTANGMPLHGRSPTLFLTFFAITGQILIMVKSLTNPITYATRIPEIREFVHGLLDRCATQSTIDRRRRERILRTSEYVGAGGSGIAVHRRSSSNNRQNNNRSSSIDKTRPLQSATMISSHPQSSVRSKFEPNDDDEASFSMMGQPSRV